MIEPEKQAARALTKYAVKTGKLAKYPCEVCGSVEVEAHHKDYTKPLDVNWLCRIHHKEAHGNKGVLINPRPLLLKLKEEDHARWKTAAEERRLSLSEWIRLQCNNSANVLQRTDNEQNKGVGSANGSAAHQDVSRIPATIVSGRSIVAGRRTNGGSVRSADGASGKRIDKAKLRSTKELVAGADDRNKPVDSVAPHPELTLTAANFAEHAADIPRDELDFWARSLPREVLPSHSSTSNRHTCLCTFCLVWRKTNSIPYGGPVKKEKKEYKR